MANHEYTFNFPVNNRAKTWDLELKHAAGEVAEACLAKTTYERIVEVLDAIECLEQALRQMAGTYGLQDAYEAHYRKNEARGDYDRSR